MIYSYGQNEVDKDNFNRLLSAEPKELLVIDPLVIYPNIIFPRNSIILIDSIMFQFKPSIIAINRYVGFQVMDESFAIKFELISPCPLTALNNTICSFCRDIDSNYVAGSQLNLRLPTIPIIPAHTCNISTLNLQAGDDMSWPVVIYRELILNK